MQETNNRKIRRKSSKRRIKVLSAVLLGAGWVAAKLIKWKKLMKSSRWSEGQVWKICRSKGNNSTRTDRWTNSMMNHHSMINLSQAPGEWVLHVGLASTRSFQAKDRWINQLPQKTRTKVSRITEKTLNVISMSLTKDQSCSMKRWETSLWPKIDNLLRRGMLNLVYRPKPLISLILEIYRQSLTL